MTVKLHKIVSGGQTGVDQGALDAAIAVGVPHGGWCPKGRRSEAGPIPGCYQLQETPSPQYPVRTRWNVRDSDATLVLRTTEPTGGTALTIELAKKFGKPCLITNPALAAERANVVHWLREHGVGVLNVAGPRESESPGIQQATKTFLEALLVHIRPDPPDC